MTTVRQCYDLVHMTDRFNRRDALKAVVAGTMALIEPLRAEVPHPQLTLRSTPVELSVTTVSAHTVRLTVLPVENGKAQP